VLRCVHAHYVTACRNAVTLIRSYKLNPNPEHHDVTLGFPVCYGSPSDVFAASSGFVHFGYVYSYTVRFEGKEKLAAVVANATVRKHGSGQWFKFVGRLEFAVGQRVI